MFPPEVTKYVNELVMLWGLIHTSYGTLYYRASPRTSGLLTCNPLSYFTETRLQTRNRWPTTAPQLGTVRHPKIKEVDTARSLVKASSSEPKQKQPEAMQKSVEPRSTRGHRALHRPGQTTETLNELSTPGRPQLPLY